MGVQIHQHAVGIQRKDRSAHGVTVSATPGRRIGGVIRNRVDRVA
jgi:hypothetical protein